MAPAIDDTAVGAEVHALRLEKGSRIATLAPAPSRASTSCLGTEDSGDTIQKDNAAAPLIMQYLQRALELILDEQEHQGANAGSSRCCLAHAQPDTVHAL